MTKLEIATYCCKKLGVNEPATLTLAGDFAAARWRMIWNQAPWRQTRWQASVAVPANTADITLPVECEFVTAVRCGPALLAASDDFSTIANDPPGYDATGPVMSFSQLGKNATGAAMIRLHQVPAVATALLVIGKRKCVELTLGTDTPLIPGIDECLTAFVMGDLQQWMRQMTKAQIYFEEANTLLQKMIDIETGQTAEVRRIVPYVQEVEDGY